MPIVSAAIGLAAAAAGAIGAGAAAAGSVLGPAAGAVGSALGTQGLIASGSNIAGGFLKQGSLDSANRQMAEAANKEQQSYRDAQKLLQKGQNDAISSLEIANLKSQGLIDKSTAESIDRLNNTQGGAIKTLNDFASKSDQIYATAAQNSIKQVLDSGLMSRDSITGAQLNSIKSLTGWNDEAFHAITGGSEKAIKAINEGKNVAIASLEPYQKAGEQAIKKVQFLGGLLPADQQEAAAKEFGTIQSSPLYQFRQAETQKLLDRQLKAGGKLLSGAGFEAQQKALNQLSAEETQRQLDTAQNVANLGFGAAQNAAGLQTGAAQNIANSYQSTGSQTGQLAANTGSQISGVQQNTGAQLANQYNQQGQNIAGILQNTGANQAGLYNQVGSNIANLQLGIGQTQAQMAQQAGLTQAQLSAIYGSNMANIQQQGGAQQAGLAVGGANQQYNSSVNQAQLGYASNIAPVEGALSGISQGLQYSNFNQYQQPQYGLPQYNIQQPAGLNYQFGSQYQQPQQSYQSAPLPQQSFQSSYIPTTQPTAPQSGLQQRQTNAQNANPQPAPFLNYQAQPAQPMFNYQSAPVYNNMSGYQNYTPNANYSY